MVEARRGAQNPCSRRGFQPQLPPFWLIRGTPLIACLLWSCGLGGFRYLTGTRCDAVGRCMKVLANPGSSPAIPFRESRRRSLRSPLLTPARNRFSAWSRPPRLAGRRSGGPVRRCVWWGAESAHARTAGPPCGGPVHCLLTCAGSGARVFRAARYRRRNKVSTAAAGIAARRGHLEGKARGSGGRGVRADGQKTWYDIGTICFGARAVRMGWRCLAWSPARRRSWWRRPAGRTPAGRTGVAARGAARGLSTAWSARSSVPAPAVAAAHPARRPQEWLVLPAA
jgi:hypothetical protein